MNGQERDKVVYVHNGVFLSREDQNFVITVKTDGSQNHVVPNKQAQKYEC